MKTPATTQPPADIWPVLSIDKQSLRDLFLPELALVVQSRDYLDKAARLAFKQCKSADHRTPEYDALNTARCLVLRRIEELVDTINYRGGLLLIGGAA